VIFVVTLILASLMTEYSKQDGVRLKINPEKVEFDGHSFRLIIENETDLINKLKDKQHEIIKDLERVI
jgi:hypothetical protein